MAKLISGLHHVTALASDPQRNVDFYTKVLGLRLVKKTINFDAPDVYHLYYGDQTGKPGTIMTFFPFPGMYKGKRGSGQLTVTAFSIQADALDFWMGRLADMAIDFQGPTQRWNETVLYLEDPDGIGIELVANKADARMGYEKDDIPAKHAIKGFHHVQLDVRRKEGTQALLTNYMNHEVIAEMENRVRVAANDEPGAYVDLKVDPSLLAGREGAGVVHHVAFRTESDGTQLEIKEKLRKIGYHSSPVMDRQYFHSVYFREPNGILFEIATDPPGFLIDEDEATLGEMLKLPPWEESRRQQIENGLVSLS
ncbi:MAG: ring-cleaving dioxygenase [Bacteroidota bacterium]